MTINSRLLRRRGFIASAASAALLFDALLLARSAQANPDTYPVKPIKLVIPFGPGAFTDIVSRQLAREMSTILGQPIVPDNRPGALTSLAASVVAQAPADGYTLLIGSVGAMASNPAGLLSSVSYDAAKDFTPISHIGSVIYVLIVNPSLPVKTVDELVAYARKNPGLKYGSGNIGGRLYMGMLENTQKLSMVSVSYKGSPPALNDLMGGHIDVMVTDANSALPLAKAGKVRLVAIAGGRRSPLAPDIPTLHELGYKNIRDVPGWIGLYGPAGLRPDIVSSLNKAANAAMQAPEMKIAAERAGMDMRGSTPEELAHYTREQFVFWKDLVSEFKLTPE
jgi:tripartite-type tricarboxylate transporter receptor subunit TctC